MYEGVHYPADVLESLIVALLGVGLVTLVHSRTRQAGNATFRSRPSPQGMRSTR